MPGFKCVYLHCSERSGEKTSLFRFPKDQLRSEIWLKAAGREDLLQKNPANYKLCEKHFESKFVYSTSAVERPKKITVLSAATAAPTTPLQIQTRRQKVLNMTGAVTSPPTPHRIELRSDYYEENNCKKHISCQPPAPKARKKLLNNHIVSGINHDNELKNLEIKESAKNNVTNHKVNGQHKLTEYFPVRRSVRKTKTTMLEEQQLALEKLVRNEVEDGLEVRLFEGKGRGVIATKDFCKGDFVVEYSGELVDIIEAKEREEMYAKNENAGCYMYYFKHNGLQYCIDATEETGRLGRLVNHSRSNPNLVTKTIVVDKKPRLVLIAKEDIKEGEEILYDYGDRSKESLQYHPWLAY